MAKEIAVYVGENGETTSLYDHGKIIVYGKNLDEWSVLREKGFVMDKASGMKELRGKITEALAFLNGCRIFVGQSISGVPYFELEKSGFSVWEFEGKPMEFLNYVLEEEEARQLQEAGGAKKNVIPVPVETSHGCYQISIKEIQENDTGLTSKQVLLPFLQKGVFYSLEVLCSHVPPWLQAELFSSNICGEIENTGNKEVRIMITRNCCQ